MYEQHLDELDGLPVTSGGEYDPDAGASWGPSGGGASAGCLPSASAGGDEGGALTGDVVESVRVGPYTADIKLERRDGGLWIACAMISTETGVLSWCGAATEQEVAQRIARRRGASATAGSGFNFGSFLNSLSSQINQGAQQLARQRTLRRVVRDVNTTLNRPELQPVLAVAQQIPYLGQALTAVRAAATMADQVLQGNPRARGRLESIRAAAQRGNPIARQALEVLNDVLRSQQRSAQQRAGVDAPARSQGAGRPPGVRRPGPRRPRRSRSRRPAHPASRGRPQRGRARTAGGSAREERAWREASARWAEHARQRAVLVTPPPPPPAR